eukprot:COSAG01_NODE_5380_length_4295_cov_312.910867_5_plen_71_part_00
MMAEVFARGPIACSMNASNPDFEGLHCAQPRLMHAHIIARTRIGIGMHARMCGGGVTAVRPRTGCGCAYL